MSSRFDDVMGPKSDRSLVAIAQSTEDDYQPDAIEAAKRELAKRNLPVAQLAMATHKVAVDAEQKRARAEEPLDAGYIAVAIVAPAVAFLAISSNLRRNGYTRKARELARWCWRGLALNVAWFVCVLIWNACNA